jgi:serine protease Do
MQRGLGSGVVVDAEKGYVVTNYHVVRGADQVELVAHDGREFAAEWIRTDRQTDLAVIKVKGAKGLIDVPLGDSDKAEVGDWVLAVGAPAGLPQTVTAGIISAKGRSFGGRLIGPSGYEDFIQTDAAINRGNSGGPLVNLRGEVIGINNAIITASRVSGNEGIALAIPSNMVKDVMRQLIDKGKVVRGYLGVMIQDVNDELAESFKLPHSKGALVTNVLKGSPAAEAGVKEDDFIVAVNGKPVKGVNELRNEVAQIAPGKEVELELYRGGEKTAVKVKIGTLPEDVVAAPGGEEPSRPKRYGLEVETLTKELAERRGYDEDTRGVLVTDVESDSDAAEKGVRPGMVIDSVNGERVTTAAEFERRVAAAAGKKVRIRALQPGGRGRELRRYYVISPK